MESERNFKISGDSPCLLMGLDGVTYQAQLGNLSLTGALIKMSDDVRHGLHIGEMCGLVLSDNPNMSSSKHTGIIIELDAGSVSVSFHHQEHHHQKHKYFPSSS
jgi:hypothetical protein